MSYPFRQAICNEVFQGWDFAEQCRTIKRFGYDGIEIAHFTLADDPVSLTPARRRELARIIVEEGLAFAGLHWLMVAPKGLHVTTPDAALRARSWLHIATLIDLCGDLGGGKMIFGSPAQRKSTGGATRQEATARYLDGLRQAAPHAASRGVTLLMEPLPTHDTDVLNTLAEAAACVAEIGSPAVQTMYDTHNAVLETEPHELLVDRYYEVIQHVHVNEMDGRHPGTGDWDFKPVLRVLAAKGYKGWISMEAFDFSAGAERIAKESVQYLRSEINKL
ncbi:MAG: sugar phosphate isomerase/epimerase family protein [Acidobacteriota bacterium]|jgi:sugar phosphate isomerase/epimerase|nr:sugar phosphate isomerase/epimerase [Bryobacteraceae bacterium CoA2 C42]MCA2965508.1 sugar phosphate isomerase/epimerase [Acidobacteriaceae bacterium]